MLKLTKNSKSYFKWVVLLLTPVLFTCCKKLVDVESPTTEISSANVFSTNSSAAAALTGIYTQMSTSDQYNNGLPSLYFYSGMSGDELTLFEINNLNYSLYYTNGLSAANTGGVDFWKSTYPLIYDANAAIDGLTGNGSLTPSVQQQLLGEAYFVRAFCYFYLVNLYGDVPLVTTANYKDNESFARSPQTQVWNQIIADLKDAQNLLSPNYLYSDAQTETTERTRPNRWVATALLARAYLYTGDWNDAVMQSTNVINNTSLFSLDTLNGVFLANSNEAIWQLQPMGSGTSSNTGEGKIFVLPSTGPGFYNPVVLSKFMLSSFEANDMRRTNWVDSVIVGAATYYYAYKYKIGAVNTSTAEYSMVFRLGEQYLIRSEAEAKLGNLSEAVSDVNVIRERAGLNGLDTLTAVVQPAVLSAIFHERKVELFAEWGHRWLDLKRTMSIDSVMGGPGNVYSYKSGKVWNTDLQWYPIAQSELAADPKLVQNSGY